MEKLEGKIAVFAPFGDSNRLPYETLRLTLGRWLFYRDVVNWLRRIVQYMYTSIQNRLRIAQIRALEASRGSHSAGAGGRSARWARRAVRSKTATPRVLALRTQVRAAWIDAPPRRDSARARLGDFRLAHEAARAGG